MGLWCLQVLLAVQRVHELMSSGRAASEPAATTSPAGPSADPDPVDPGQREERPQPQPQLQPAVPWALVTAWGIADSPISHACMEHGAAAGWSTADSQLSVLLMPGGEYVLFKPLPAGEG